MPSSFKSPMTLVDNRSLASLVQVDMKIRLPLKLVNMTLEETRCMGKMMTTQRCGHKQWSAEDPLEAGIEGRTSYLPYPHT